MPVKISKPAINLREELASLRNQGGLPKEDKLYVGELITNGTFDNGTTGWTNSPATASLAVSNGSLTLTRNGASGEAHQLLETETGKSYKITFTLSAVSHGAAVNYQGYSSGVKSTAGTYSFIAVGNENFTKNLKLQIFNSSTGTATFDNISVQEVGKNLVTNGDFSNGTSGWNSYGASGSVASGVLTVTNGSTDHQGLVQNFKVQIGKSYTITGKVTGGTSTAKLLIGSSQGNASLHNTTVTAGSTSTVNVTVVPTSANFYVSLQISSANGTGLYEDITVTEGNHHVIQSVPYGYDVKDVYIDGELAREGEAYDYEVKTDGINQWLKPTVEPTATTETVVIGVRK